MAGRIQHFGAVTAAILVMTVAGAAEAAPCGPAGSAAWHSPSASIWTRVAGARTAPGANSRPEWIASSSRTGGKAAAVAVVLPPSAGAVSRGRCPGRRAMPTAEVQSIVSDLASEFDVEADLVMAMMEVESAFRPDAVSPKNAQGLMQLIPATAARFGVADPFDPRQNIEGGVRYLRWLLDRFDGDTVLAVAAYNAGEQAVERHGGIPPFDETKAYVRKVFGLYDGDRSTASRTGTPAPKTIKPKAAKSTTTASCFEIASDGTVRRC